MTDPFEPGDPIGSWLGADVELLPPKPDGFQKVRRRARRHKTAQAAGVAAGAMVAIAAIVTGPRIASTLLPPAPDNIGKVSASSHPSSTGPRVQRPVRSSPPNPSADGSAKPLGPGTALPAAGSGVAVPPGLQPGSVTFVNGSVGAVLGQLGPPCRGICTALAGTPDYGQHWYGFSAPPVGGPAGHAGISQVRFLNYSDGWAYGPELYATHDGGRTWKSITGLPSGRVIDLATVAGRAYAVLAGCTGTGAAYATGCTSFALITAAAGSDTWTQVTGARGTGVPVTGGLQLTHAQGYLMVSGALYAGPTSGGAWHRVQVAAAGAPPCLTGRTGAAGPWLIAPGPAGTGTLYLACPASGGGQLTLYASPDFGQTWTVQGPVAAAGQATSLTLTPGGGALVLATSQGLNYSADYKTWKPAAVAGGVPAGGFSFAGMTNSALGVAVPASGQAHEVFITTNGGLSWQPSVIH